MDPLLWRDVMAQKWLPWVAALLLFFCASCAGDKAPAACCPTCQKGKAGVVVHCLECGKCFKDGKPVTCPKKG